MELPLEGMVRLLAGSVDTECVDEDRSVMVVLVREELRFRVAFPELGMIGDAARIDRLGLTGVLRLGWWVMLGELSFVVIALERVGGCAMVGSFWGLGTCRRCVELCSRFSTIVNILKVRGRQPLTEFGLDQS